MKHLLLGAAVGGALAAPAFGQTASTTLPSGPQHGTGISVSASGAEMTINQSTGREIINWQSFSIGSAAWVRFNQPGASSVVLNRVVGGSASEIFGRLTANGQVFLTNPNGVLFAPGASVEVGSLFASTLSISNDDFFAGRYRFSGEGNAASVVNQGTIITPNGYTALAGPRVRNDGVIVARLGSVALAAGERVSLDMIGGGLINVSVDQGVLNATAVNSGTIEANGGRVILTARGASNLLDGVVNNSGVIRANSLVERNGEIILNAESVQMTGSLETLGGSAVVQGSGLVNIVGTAAVNAGAGSILITSGNVGASGSTVTTGSFDIGSGHVIVHGDGAVTAPGGTITIGSGMVNLSGTTAIDAHGDSAVTLTGSAITVAGNAINLSGHGGPVTLSGEDLRMRALAPNLRASGSTTAGEVVRAAAGEAHVAAAKAAVPDFAASRAAALDGPPGLLPRLPILVQGTGVLLPPDASTTSPASR